MLIPLKLRSVKVGMLQALKTDSHLWAKSDIPPGKSQVGAVCPPSTAGENAPLVNILQVLAVSSVHIAEQCVRRLWCPFLNIFKLDPAPSGAHRA